MDSPLETPEGRQPYGPTVNFWSLQLQGNKYVLFYATKFAAICYSEYRN